VKSENKIRIHFKGIKTYLFSGPPGVTQLLLPVTPSQSQGLPLGWMGPCLLFRIPSFGHSCAPWHFFIYVSYITWCFPTYLTSTLKMEAVCSSKKLVLIEQTTWCDNTEDHNMKLSFVLNFNFSTEDLYVCKNNHSNKNGKDVHHTKVHRITNGMLWSLLNTFKNENLLTVSNIKCQQNLWNGLRDIWRRPCMTISKLGFIMVQYGY
jgi:hypothetical protein